MQRFALGVEYKGSDYVGWQSQVNQRSIQSALENALSTIAADKISVCCAGRTDAGVHALGQVIHFDTVKQRPNHAWVIGANTYLPKDISVQWCQPVDATFDARKSALWRRYAYVIHNCPTRPSTFHQAMTWVRKELDIIPMQQAAHYLLGKHDFTSFRGQHCQAKTAIRTISHLNIFAHHNIRVIDIKANAFLHHMVRNIVGSLISVGHRKQAPEWIKTVLDAQDRSAAGVMADPTGLYLAQVGYPSLYLLPNKASLGWIFKA